MAAKMTILATREQGTLVSTWTEYLVLNKSPGANPKLEICAYEVLAESGKYWDEGLEEFVLPDEIDGKYVARLEDGYVVGGDHKPVDDIEALNLEGLNLEAILGWLGAQKFALHPSELADLMQSKR